jgi:hypothetical protein
MTAAAMAVAMVVAMAAAMTVTAAAAAMTAVTMMIVMTAALGAGIVTAAATATATATAAVVAVVAITTARKQRRQPQWWWWWQQQRWPWGQRWRQRQRDSGGGIVGGSGNGNGGDSGGNNNDANNDDSNLENLAQEKLRQDHHCRRHSQQAGLKYPARHHQHWLGWWQEQLEQQWHHSWLHSLWNQFEHRLHHLGFGEAAWLYGHHCHLLSNSAAGRIWEGIVARVSVSETEQRWREPEKAIELFKFILINWREGLREVLYQANYLLQIVISAGLLTDLLSVNLLICQSLIFEIFGDRRLPDWQIADQQIWFCVNTRISRIQRYPEWSWYCSVCTWGASLWRTKFWSGKIYCIKY